jgi:hypothetical protein
VRTVERLHDRVEERLLGISGIDGRFDLGVDALDDGEGQELLDDHHTVARERVVDRVGHIRKGSGVATLDRRTHVSSELGHSLNGTR